MSRKPPSPNGYHASSPTTPLYFMHARFDPRCGLQRPFTTEKDARVTFEDSGVVVTISECDCANRCTCEGAK